MPRHLDPAAPGTREALLEAGLLCFSERGYAGTSLRQVADRAGRTTSLIAHHFGNKEGLYLAVFRDMLARRPPGHLPGAVASAEELRQDPDRAAALLRSLVVGLFLEMHAAFDGHDPRRMAEFRLWLSAVRAPVPELEALMHERLAPLRRQIAACIQALRPDLTEAELPFWCALVHGQCLVNTLLRSFNQMVFGPGSYPDAAGPLAERIADITLQAVGRTAPALRS